jgi:hypothetical protein
MTVHELCFTLKFVGITKVLVLDNPESCYEQIELILWLISGTLSMNDFQLAYTAQSQGALIYEMIIIVSQLLDFFYTFIQVQDEKHARRL